MISLTKEQQDFDAVMRQGIPMVTHWTDMSKEDVDTLLSYIVELTAIANTSGEMDTSDINDFTVTFELLTEYLVNAKILDESTFEVTEKLTFDTAVTPFVETIIENAVNFAQNVIEYETHYGIEDETLNIAIDEFVTLTRDYRLTYE